MNRLREEGDLTENESKSEQVSLPFSTILQRNTSFYEKLFVGNRTAERKKCEVFVVGSKINGFVLYSTVDKCIYEQRHR